MLFVYQMPRFKQLNEIQQLMSQKGQIRNLGIVAHIDHGKTTLADALLAGVGLLSPQMAGSARVLDYLAEEQRRKITIKTANISLLIKRQNTPYLINLVDTPGHVDFTGKVTRALRAIDGVVVLVDAVEEIMAQTEIVTRQALAERVQPVLFINKVDRLITEMQLSAEQIEQKLYHIIGGFNDLIELYGEKPFSNQWKVNPAKGSVAFGSALHGWGFTLGIAKGKGAKFNDVIAAYKNASQQQLSKTLPVYNAIFEMAVSSLPDPKTAQAYRVEKIWSGMQKSDAGAAIAGCDDEEMAVMCVTQVEPDLTGGSIVTGRLFSGTIREGDTLHCVNALRETVVKKVYVYMGSFKEVVSQVSAGNIAVLAVSEVLRAGETLVDVAHKVGMVPFEGINYVSEPVVTVAVEPKDPKDIFDVLKALHKLVTEDPNLAVNVDKETGEYLLSVMGELHLEVALNQLKVLSGGLEVSVSAPRIVYRETATKKGAAASALSPNRQNRFTVQVEPQEQGQPEQIQVYEQGSVLSIDEYRNVLVNCNLEKEPEIQEVLEAIISGFEFACNAGPLCAEPMRHVKVNLLDVQLSVDKEQQSPTEVMHGVGKAIFGAFLSAQPVLLEPVYKTVITVPTELAGECSRIVETRRGKISAFEQKGQLTVITGHIPVSETFGLSKELRSATSGRAFWQNMLESWLEVPKKVAPKVITAVRQRKGLALQVPDAERFLEEH
jgi:elongation factor 2